MTLPAFQVILGVALGVAGTLLVLKVRLASLTCGTSFGDVPSRCTCLPAAGMLGQALQCPCIRYMAHDFRGRIRLQTPT